MTRHERHKQTRDRSDGWSHNHIQEEEFEITWPDHKGQPSFDYNSTRYDFKQKKKVGERGRQHHCVEWKIIHRDSDISTQPRHMKEAGQVLRCVSILWLMMSTNPGQVCSVHFALVKGMNPICCFFTCAQLVLIRSMQLPQPLRRPQIHVIVSAIQK